MSILKCLSNTNKNDPAAITHWCISSDITKRVTKDASPWKQVWTLPGDRERLEGKAMLGYMLKPRVWAGVLMSVFMGWRMKSWYKNLSGPQVWVPVPQRWTFAMQAWSAWHQGLWVRLCPCAQESWGGQHQSKARGGLSSNLSSATFAFALSSLHFHSVSADIIFGY